MALAQIKSTSLWKHAFEKTVGESNDDAIAKLKIDFLSFREKVSHLVGKIFSVLPSLTVHDVSHLDALWVTAETIAGDDYHLNPLETFILGGSILLHDAAMCWEAYENGQEGVRDTVFWRDAYAFELSRSDVQEAATQGDFTTIRYLHSKRASKLATMKWRLPESEDYIYLINDTEIRHHLGEIIGLIAASHHWDISEISEKLSNQFNAPDFLPRQWTVDPVKIACLLRVADASHISNARAPDFLLALNKRVGISLNHWKAQNKISGPQIDLTDLNGSTVTYTSTTPFLEKDSDAWWVAYDTITMINAEIKSCNALLEGRNIANSKPFKTKAVSGAESVQHLRLPKGSWVDAPQYADSC